MAVEKHHQASESVPAGGWRVFRQVADFIPNQESGVDLADQQRPEVDWKRNSLVGANSLAFSDWDRLCAEQHWVATDQEYVLDASIGRRVADLEFALVGLGVNHVLEIVLHLDSGADLDRLRKHLIGESFLLQYELARKLGASLCKERHFALKLIEKLPLDLFNRDHSLLQRRHFQDDFDGTFAGNHVLVALAGVVSR